MNIFSTPGQTIVVKFGGNAMGNALTEALLSEIAGLRATGTQVVLVHGGGPEIDRELENRGIASKRVEGQRVTTAEILAVTEAVLCGTVNKALVRACLAHGMPAVGISGEDAQLLVAEKATPEMLQPRDPAARHSFDVRSAAATDLGLVGKVISVQPRILRALLDADFLPVIAPLGVAPDGSTAYNINGDLSAGAIAGALRAEAFFLVTNVDRIRRTPEDPTTGIDRISLDEARAFYSSDACKQSMKPKLAAAIAAVEAGTTTAYVCAARENAIARAVAGESTLINSS